MFCYNCGKELENSSKFCTFCGAMQPTGEAASVPQPVAPAPQAVYQAPAPQPVYEALKQKVTLPSDFERTLKLCRHPVMFAFAVIVSLFGIVSAKNVIDFIGVLDMIDWEFDVILSVTFSLASYAAYILLTIGSWMTIAGGFGKHMLAERGIGVMRSGLVSGAVGMIVYGVTYVIPLLSALELGGGYAERMLPYLIGAIATCAFFSWLHFSIAKCLWSFRYNLALAADRRDDGGVPFLMGRGIGMTMLIAMGVIAALVLALGEELDLESLLSSLGSDGATLIFLGFFALYVLGGVLLMMQHYVIQTWTRVFTGARSLDKRLR